MLVLTAIFMHFSICHAYLVFCWSWNDMS